MTNGGRCKTVAVAALVALVSRPMAAMVGTPHFYAKTIHMEYPIERMNKYVVLLRLGSQISPAVDDKWGPLEPARVFLDRMSAEAYVRSLPLYWYRLRLLEYRIVELPLAEYWKWGSYFDEQ